MSYPVSTDLQQRLDRNYRYQRHVYDWTRRYYLLGRDALIAELEPPQEGSLLEIGCGTARNLIKCAQHYPSAQLYGIDLSAAMLETARSKLAAQGMRRHVALAQADATDFDPLALFGRRTFDRVFFSYSLSMIPAWREALAHAAAFVGQGGELHIVDFGSGSRLPGAARGALDVWLAHFHVTPRREIMHELSLIAAKQDFELELSEPFATYVVRAILRRANTPSARRTHVLNLANETEPTEARYT